MFVVKMKPTDNWQKTKQINTEADAAIYSLQMP